MPETSNGDLPLKPRTIPQTPRVSRRDFLKSAAYLTGAALTELYAGPFNAILRASSKLGPEGNLDQRASVLEDLLRRNILDPSQKNKDLLGGWAGFTAAEIELHRLGYPLAERMMRHYLYGGGKKEAISYEYAQFLKNFGRYPTSYQEAPFIMPATLVKNYEATGPIASPQTQSLFVEQLFLESDWSSYINDQVKTRGQRIVRMPQSGYETQIKSRQRFPISVSAVVGSEADQDIFNALHNYTLTVDGTVIGARTINSPSDLGPDDITFNLSGGNNEFIQGMSDFYYPHHRLLLANPNVRVFDTYDFTRTQEMPGHQATVGDIVGIAGKDILGTAKYTELQNKLPQSARQWLYETKVVELNQYKSGTLLADEGLAHVFEIRGTVPLEAPIEIPILQSNVMFLN